MKQIRTTVYRTVLVRVPVPVKKSLTVLYFNIFQRRIQQSSWYSILKKMVPLNSTLKVLPDRYLFFLGGRRPYVRPLKSSMFWLKTVNDLTVLKPTQFYGQYFSIFFRKKKLKSCCGTRIEVPRPRLIAVEGT